MAKAASSVGMHWRHWQKIEMCSTNATLRTLERITVALDVKPQALFEPKPRFEPKPQKDE